MNDSLRFRHLDAIKGICILFVLITHYNWAADEKLKLFFPFWIAMAVPIFMIISGFVYTRSFQHKNVTELSEMYSCRLIIKRIVRYTVPFLMVYVVESLLRIGLHRLEWKDIFFDFLRGGGWTGKLLLSDYAPVYFRVSAYL